MTTINSDMSQSNFRVLMDMESITSFGRGQNKEIKRDELN
jgi:hypothetical protein